MLKIHGYYLPVWQNDTLQKQEKIRLLITDYDDRQKIENVVKHVGGDDAKSPLKWIRGDYLLEVKAPLLATYRMLSEDKSSSDIATLHDLLGMEVEATLEMRRHAFKSKYQANLGEKITSVSAKVKSLSGL